MSLIIGGLTAPINLFHFFNLESTRLRVSPRIKTVYNLCNACLGWISKLKRGVSSLWSFRPNSTWDSIETTTIGKMDSTLEIAISYFMLLSPYNSVLCPFFSSESAESFILSISLKILHHWNFLLYLTVTLPSETPVPWAP